ncbi:MAG: NTP transferase domain-containing protein [Spirochaetes bacterium]|nr:NTP transferase domain-containing protein [Spirochaetota bacterium]
MEKGIKAVVLAAGKGVRMKSELPKVLHLLAGKPLTEHVIGNLRKSGINDIILVIGYKGEEVQKAIGDSVKYVWQHEQLGTGHAVLMADELLSDFKGNVLVACGDAPLISDKSFRLLIEKMKNDDVKASVLTMILDNPHGYGRMIKDNSGNLVRIVEEKDATDEERKINEVNTGTYVFDSEILFDGLKKIGNNNAQKEYYLPDIIGYIKSLGYKAVTCVLDNPFEGSGINSREELQKIEDLIK